VKVFLDLDGPILDVSQRYYTIYTDLLGAAGHRPLSKADYWRAKRNRTPEAEILRCTCPEPFIAAYLQQRLAVIEAPRYLLLDEVWEDARKALDDWYRRHTLFLVTLRNRRAALEEQLDHLGLLSCFTHVYSEDNNEGNAQVKERLIRSEIDDPTQCLIIGDTEADLEAGKALGIGTVAVSRGIRTGELLARCCPDQLVGDLSAVVLRERANLGGPG
jgi:phosphoglycolate phosphatase-like HAD superfamily hydrolase